MSSLALTAGTRLGAYEVTAQIGEGGMGQVYRARDTKLNRDVALKVLPDSFAGDPDRLARFQREAQVLASLNHPHIAHIHGLEDGGGVRALVMELVEGEDLAQRIAHGLLPLEEALPIAKQIAEALEAAHEQGVIHRDLKPANVKVRPDGTVKVLDFGLAKAMDPMAPSPSPNMSESPTITTPAMTQAGFILGTAAYMSPEQASGKPMDRRADIWSFGVLLWELLTGERLFRGETVSHTLADVLRAEIDFGKLPDTTPVTIRDLLRRCLDRDGKSRLRDIGEARIAIERAIAQPLAPAISSSAQNSAKAATVRARSTPNRVAPWAVAGVLGLSLAVVLVRWSPWKQVPATQGSQRLNADLGVDVSLDMDVGVSVALSPDGQTLAFVARAQRGGERQLYVRRLDQLQATLLTGTTDAYSPFFSPDGQWIGFFAGGKLKKVSTTGSATVTLCDAPNGRGGSWAEDGTIVFTPDSVPGASLLRVSAGGGKPEPLTPLADGEATQRWPQLLPGGKSVLYTTSSMRGGIAFAAAGVMQVIQNLSTRERKIVQRGGFHGRYLPSGHLVYVQDATLFAAPFDLARLELTGQPTPLVDGIVTNVATAGAQFSVSDTGTLVYLPGRITNSGGPISWMDKRGTFTALRAVPADWNSIRFSPDGRRVAMDISDGKQRDVWTYDWARETMTRLTFDPTDDASPIWTPDGSRIVFASKRADKTVYNLYWQRADGTGEVQRLTESKNHQIPNSWLPSGKILTFHEIFPSNETASDIMILPIEGSETLGWKPGKPAVFLNTPAAEQSPMFSPDGHWLAYESNESGQFEVYVRPFPGPGGKWQISNSGGTYATWSRARRELFYSTTDLHLMVAPYTVEGASFVAEKPRPWSERQFSPGLYRRFDVHPDGERFAVSKDPDADSKKQDKVVFVFNFFDELKRIAPTERR